MSKNSIRVSRFNKTKGYELQKKKYHILRKKYGIGSVRANNMKYWGRERILDYLQCNNIRPITPRVDVIHDEEVDC